MEVQHLGSTTRHAAYIEKNESLDTWSPVNSVNNADI